MIRAQYAHNLGDAVTFQGHAYWVRGRGYSAVDDTPAYDLRPVDTASPQPGRFVRQAELEAENYPDDPPSPLSTTDPIQTEEVKS